LRDQASRQAKDALRSQRTKLDSDLPVDLIERVYAIEERVQFDGDRRDAAAKIREQVQTYVEQATESANQ
jgi:hypothetical protein